MLGVSASVAFNKELQSLAQKDEQISRLNDVWIIERYTTMGRTGIEPKMKQKSVCG